MKPNPSGERANEALILRELNERLERLFRGDFSPVRQISAEAPELQTLVDLITRFVAYLGRENSLRIIKANGW